MEFKKHVLEHGNEKITSPFGKRKDPVTGEDSFHRGVDLVNGRADRVLAYQDGVVQKTRNTYKGRTKDGSAGNFIIIQHDGYDTVYYHLKQNSLLVKAGDKVVAGQPIATIGNTGHTTGRHLHFGIDDERGKGWIDPVPLLCEEETKDNVFGNRGAYPTIKWGNKSEAFTKLFQQWLNDVKKSKILSDGIPGNRTYAFAKKYKVGYGNDNYAAKYVQNRLKQFNLYSGKCDGEPRSLTVNSIKKFESLYGLKVDGVISGTDWYYILAKEV